MYCRLMCTFLRRSQKFYFRVILSRLNCGSIMWKNIHLFVVATISNLKGNYLQISTFRYLNDTNGNITSPGYPANYPNNVNYTWVISTGFQLAKIYFSIPDFDIKKHDYYPCDDYLEIKEIEPCCHTLLHRCGKESINIIATGRMIRISFITDDRFTAKGFSMFWNVSFPGVPERNTVKTTLTVKQMPWTTNRIPKTTTITKLKPGPPVLATTTMMIIKIPTTHTTRMGERPSAIKTTHNNMLKKQITSKTVSIKTTRKIKATSLTKTASTELARVVEYEITLAFLETKLRTGYYTKVMVKGLNAESSTEVNVLIDGSYPEPKAPESTSLNIYAVFFAITSTTTLLLVVLILFRKKKIRFPLSRRRTVQTASTSGHDTQEDTYAHLQKSRKTCSDTYGVDRMDPDDAYLDIMCMNSGSGQHYRSTDELQNNDYLQACFGNRTESKTYVEIAECYV